MNLRRLGWAGVEIEADGATIVIDPLNDAAALYKRFAGVRAEALELPDVVEPARPGSALAGLVTHLHRDHTDASALVGALAPGAPVLRPAPGGGGDMEELGLRQAEHELRKAGLEMRVVEPWQTFEIGPFAVTALPAADGLGEPQLSWAVEAGGLRLVHCGDTLFHGWWWRMALRAGPFDIALLPINGPVVDFPNRRPPSPAPVAMTPEDAALAGELLQARRVVPIHYDGYAVDPFYRPVADAQQRLRAAAAGRPYEVAILAPGESLAVNPAVAV